MDSKTIVSGRIHPEWRFQENMVLHLASLVETMGVCGRSIDNQFIDLKDFICWNRQWPHLLHIESSVHRRGGNDPVLKWRVIPTKCYGGSGNSLGTAEFISLESITGEVATEILSLEAE